MITRLMLKPALMASLIAITAPVSADQSVAGTWYIVQNKEGTTKIADKKPGVGWKIVGGPYSGWDQAA